MPWIVLLFDTGLVGLAGVARSKIRPVFWREEVGEKEVMKARGLKAESGELKKLEVRIQETGVRSTRLIVHSS